ncbi:uncharacterized protein LAESUDRAFT_710574 [Laetiporus sulphureus 93-53]|uniref:Uncharacterized protein n=1 Tax=Laetiporus sulphureus 93-53 TaxID=1314785 RepID=A0A165HRP6_9APHY|nr:uncharacterized protein LAESUDRAFT_710574 [Laetiporus sulphureus 93-53]KZT12093.1 hypothetical protein LAESUDRAFT_710574 [Laetiporus sulphureus 93-53]
MPITNQYVACTMQKLTASICLEHSTFSEWRMPLTMCTMAYFWTMSECLAPLITMEKVAKACQTTMPWMWQHTEVIYSLTIGHLQGLEQDPHKLTEALEQINSMNHCLQLMNMPSSEIIEPCLFHLVWWNFTTQYPALEPELLAAPSSHSPASRLPVQGTLTMAQPARHLQDVPDRIQGQVLHPSARCDAIPICTLAEAMTLCVEEPPLEMQGISIFDEAFPQRGSLQCTEFKDYGIPGQDHHAVQVSTHATQPHPSIEGAHLIVTQALGSGDVAHQVTLSVSMHAPAASTPTPHLHPHPATQLAMAQLAGPSSHVTAETTHSSAHLPPPPFVLILSVEGPSHRHIEINPLMCTPAAAYTEPVTGTRSCVDGTPAAMHVNSAPRHASSAPWPSRMTCWGHPRPQYLMGWPLYEPDPATRGELLEALDPKIHKLDEYIEELA